MAKRKLTRLEKNEIVRQANKARYAELTKNPSPLAIARPTQVMWGKLPLDAKRESR